MACAYIARFCLVFEFLPFAVVPSFSILPLLFLHFIVFITLVVVTLEHHLHDVTKDVHQHSSNNKTTISYSTTSMRMRKKQAAERKTTTTAIVVQTPHRGPSRQRRKTADRISTMKNKFQNKVTLSSSNSNHDRTMIVTKHSNPRRRAAIAMSKTGPHTKPPVAPTSRNYRKVKRTGTSNLQSIAIQSSLYIAISDENNNTSNNKLSRIIYNNRNNNNKKKMHGRNTKDGNKKDDDVLTPKVDNRNNNNNTKTTSQSHLMPSKLKESDTSCGSDTIADDYGPSLEQRQHKAGANSRNNCFHQQKFRHQRAVDMYTILPSSKLPSTDHVAHNKRKLTSGVLHNRATTTTSPIWMMQPPLFFHSHAQQPRHSTSSSVRKNPEKKKHKQHLTQRDINAIRQFNFGRTAQILSNDNTSQQNQSDKNQRIHLTNDDKVRIDHARKNEDNPISTSYSKVPLPSSEHVLHSAIKVGKNEGNFNNEPLRLESPSGGSSSILQYSVTSSSNASSSTSSSMWNKNYISSSESSTAPSASSTVMAATLKLVAASDSLYPSIESDEQLASSHSHYTHHPSFGEVSGINNSVLNQLSDQRRKSVQSSSSLSYSYSASSSSSSVSFLSSSTHSSSLKGTTMLTEPVTVSAAPVVALAGSLYKEQQLATSSVRNVRSDGNKMSSRGVPVCDLVSMWECRDNNSEDGNRNNCGRIGDSIFRKYNPTAASTNTVATKTFASSSVITHKQPWASIKRQLPINEHVLSFVKETTGVVSPPPSSSPLSSLSLLTPHSEPYSESASSSSAFSSNTGTCSTSTVRQNDDKQRDLLDSSAQKIPTQQSGLEFDRVIQRPVSIKKKTSIPGVPFSDITVSKRKSHLDCTNLAARATITENRLLTNYHAHPSEKNTLTNVRRIRLNDQNERKNNDRILRNNKNVTNGSVIDYSPVVDALVAIQGGDDTEVISNTTTKWLSKNLLRTTNNVSSIHTENLVIDHIHPSAWYKKSNQNETERVLNTTTKQFATPKYTLDRIEETRNRNDSDCIHLSSAITSTKLERVAKYFEQANSVDAQDRKCHTYPRKLRSSCEMKKAFNFDGCYCVKCAIWEDITYERKTREVDANNNCHKITAIDDATAVQLQQELSAVNILDESYSSVPVLEKSNWMEDESKAAVVGCVEDPIFDNYHSPLFISNLMNEGYY